MQRPNDVSQEDLDEAWQIYLLTRGETDKGVEAIARAIMAARLQEREECAKVAGTSIIKNIGKDGGHAAKEIVASIRARK